MYIYGNSSANIMNSGTALECPIGLLYIGPDFYVYRKNGDKTELFLKVKARYLNYYKNYLYFTNERGEICRMPSDKSGPVCILVPFDCMCVNIMNDVIFFRNLSDNKKLYKSSLDGTNIAKIGDVTALFLNAYQGKLYFCDADTYNLYSCDIDGKNLRLLSDHRIYYPNMLNNEIIYSDKTIGGHICRMDLEGKNIQIICANVEAYYLNVYSNKVYFRNYQDNYSLWSCDVNSGELNKLLDADVYQINSTSKGLFFCKKLDGGKICFLPQTM